MANTIEAILPALTASTTASVVATNAVVRHRGSGPNGVIFHNRGRLLPASTGEAVVPFSCFVTKLVLCNTHTGAVAVTVQDQQSTPVLLLDARSLNASETLALDFGPEGIFMEGGVKWFAGSAGVVSGFIAVKK